MRNGQGCGDHADGGMDRQNNARVFARESEIDKRALRDDRGQRNGEIIGAAPVQLSGPF